MSANNATKAASLENRINWAHPALAAVAAQPDRLPGFLGHITQPPRARFRFEYEKKAEVLDFLRTHYPAWRDYNPAAAEKVAALSISDAQKPRALAQVPLLGQAWWATGDPRYGVAFERFYRAVPTGEMFNWDSFNGSQGSIELSAWFLLQDCPGFSAEGRIAFLDHLHAITEQAWDVHTSRWEHSTLGLEGHNWYLHGMHVLPFLGLLFPEFKRADFFLRTGWSVVEEHLRGHYRADGGARETCLGYQAGSLLCMWDFYLIAHRNGYPMTAGFAERLLNATRFILDLASPQGGLPSFGDGGHARDGLLQLAATAAALTGDRHCKYYAETFAQLLDNPNENIPNTLPLNTFWSVGLAGARTYAATRPLAPRQMSVLKGETGYAALRSSRDKNAAYLAIAAADRGPIVTSHGHNDILAIEAHAHGIRFLGEMGCAPYGTTPGRDYDQKTEAHNCLAIDGMEQVPLAGEWRWKERVSPVITRWISEETHDFFNGAHEGFYHYPEQLTLHTRKILFIKSPPTYWLVFDHLESNIENACSTYFHCCVQAQLQEDSIIVGDPVGPTLLIRAPQEDQLVPEAVNPPGLQAYRQERNLDADKTPCFAFRRRTGSIGFVWLLSPLAPGQARPIIHRLPIRINDENRPSQEAAAIRIHHPNSGCTDTILLSHLDFDAQLETADESDWGFLSFHRTVDDNADIAPFSFNHSLADGICGR